MGVRLSRSAERVVVEDRGPGVPPDRLATYFDRFVQAPEEQRRGRGHGLGLAIAQGIAELHGGLISVVNREGGGCTFAISLPLAPVGSTNGVGDRRVPEERPMHRPAVTTRPDR